MSGISSFKQQLLISRSLEINSTKARKTITQGGHLVVKQQTERGITAQEEDISALNVNINVL